MVNKVILIGNMGSDPQVRYLDGGVAVASFSLATTESYKNKNGERVDQTEWHNIVLWRGLAEFAEKYLRKGLKIYVEGRLRTRSWEDPNKGTLYRTEIYGDTVQILTPKSDNTNVSASTKPIQTPSAPVSSVAEPTTPINTNQSVQQEDDDLPF